MADRPGGFPEASGGLLARKAIAGYSPANPACSLATVTDRYDAMRAAAEVELRAQNALDAERDAAIAAQ